MAINRFNKSAPVEFDFFETPLQPLMQSLQVRQQRYDQSYALADELSNQYIDALEADRAKANAITQGWQTKIDDMVTKYDGDYSQMYKDLGALKRDITRTMAPGGIGNAMQANKKAFMDSVESERKRLEKGEITEAQFRNWYQYTSKNYQGVGEKDPVTSAYNTLSPDSIAKYVDPYELGIDVAKELEPFAGGKEVVSIGGQWVVKDGEKWEKLPKELVQSVVANRLQSNPEYINYMTQAAKHAGLTGEAGLGILNQQIYDVAGNLGATFARDNRWTTRDVKENRYGVERFKMDQIKSMIQPQVRTAPGAPMNTGLQGFKMKSPTTYGATPGDAVIAAGGRGQYEAYAASRFFRDGRTPTSSQHGVRSKNFTSQDYTNWFMQAKDDPSQVPPAFKEIFVRTYQNSFNEPGLTAAQRADKFTKEWNSLLDSFQTKNTTDIILPKNYVDDVYGNTWQSQVNRVGNTIMKMEDDGTYKEYTEDPFKGLKSSQELNATLPTSITTDTGEIGFKFSTPHGKFIVMGMDDTLPNELKNVAEIQKPMTSGKIGEFSVTMDTGTEMGAIELPARSKVALDRNGQPYLKVEIYDGQQWQTAQVSGEELATQARQRGMNVIANSNVSSQLVNQGDAKQYYDYLMNQ